MTIKNLEALRAKDPEAAADIDKKLADGKISVETASHMARRRLLYG